jgi:hypothetical protein
LYTPVGVIPLPPVGVTVGVLDTPIGEGVGYSYTLCKGRGILGVGLYPGRGRGIQYPCRGRGI